MPLGFFKTVKRKLMNDREPSQTWASSSSYTQNSQLPPQWVPAPEISHKYGKWNEAPEEEFAAAAEFCNEYALEPPKLLPSDIIDRINAIGCKAWGIEVPISSRFVGHIQNDAKGGLGVIAVHTRTKCKDACLLSDLPIISGLYDIQGKRGIYYEVQVSRMDGIIAVGTACRPYPVWRLPGWNRMSAGFHLDDFRKFFEDADGGRDYTEVIHKINSGDIVGCGYEFQTGIIFYTYNGLQLPPAFSGIYLPRQNQDVYAAIGVEGHCKFQVNFGGEVFRWKEGNEWAWRVEGHVGRLSNAPGDMEDELPAYHY